MCVSACDRHSLVMLFTMPSTGCCSLRLDYCRAALTLGAATTAERISHFPQQPQKRRKRPIAGRGPGTRPSGRTFLAFRSTRKKQIIIRHRHQHIFFVSVVCLLLCQPPPSCSLPLYPLLLLLLPPHRLRLASFLAVGLNL